jgi:hypothetical protein
VDGEGDIFTSLSLICTVSVIIFLRKIMRTDFKGFMSRVSNVAVDPIFFNAFALQ